MHFKLVLKCITTENPESILIFTKEATKYAEQNDMALTTVFMSIKKFSRTLLAEDMSSQAKIIPS